MGFFDKVFGGKSEAQFTDRVWSASPAKFLDLVEQVRESHSRGEFPLTIFHFRDAGKAAAAALSGAGIRLQPITDFAQLPVEASRMGSSEATALMCSETIPFSVRQEASQPRKHPELPPIAIHLVGHHPAPERDHDVLNLDRALHHPMTFTSYVALDEPWLRPFGIERVRKMMTILGLDENSLIESQQVSASLRSAQKRLGKHVHRELPAESCEEWMQKNLPEKL